MTFSEVDAIPSDAALHDASSDRYVLRQRLRLTWQELQELLVDEFHMEKWMIDNTSESQ